MEEYAEVTNSILPQRSAKWSEISLSAPDSKLRLQALLCETGCEHLVCSKPLVIGIND